MLNRLVRPGQTDEVKDRVVHMYSIDKMGPGRIAKLLGVTRNTVIGILNRKKVARRDPNSAQQNRRNKQLGDRVVNITPKPSNPLPKPRKRADEPPAIGPIADFPPSGHCKYTKDDVATPGWQMCGQPTGENGEPAQARSWCLWHEANRIYNHKAA